ncbi:hypothetical protein RBG61_13800 [Paludicola sp. MB14-C6]|uniref:hypothetical protein n=1 Tax=Paludihabitans sp. MB14-C6 TaxID=3070656 RepID=UPI0027DD5CBA|nr:hypothetical protein [Paludicola sp. MB14-C6]WMJ23044.1 hypothetical protein RBG61_13800 [Paludicola sp. MB14-C6]
MSELNNVSLDLKGLKIVLLGNLLLIISFFYNGPAIIVGFISNIIILIGLTELTHYSNHFQKTISFTILNMVLSAARINQPQVDIGELPLYYFIVILIRFAVNIAIYYFIWKGIAELGNMVNNRGVSHDAKVSFRFFSVLTIIEAVSLILYWINSNQLYFFATLLLVIVYITQILYFITLKQSYRSLKSRAIISLGDGEEWMNHSNASLM